MNEKLKESVTNTAFSLTLSKRQIDMLDFVRRNDGRSFLQYSQFMKTSRCLDNLGLIERLPVEQRGGVGDVSWRLTRAGEYVVGLLLECGMIQKERLKLTA